MPSLFTRTLMTTGPTDVTTTVTKVYRLLQISVWCVSTVVLRPLLVNFMPTLTVVKGTTHALLDESLNQ